MYDDMYEVTRDEFVGSIKQINPKYFIVDKTESETYTITRILSRDRKRTFGCHIISKPEEEFSEKYYIIDMPFSTERQLSKPVRTLRLENKEEVQAFFDILEKVMNKKHD